MLIIGDFEEFHPPLLHPKIKECDLSLKVSGKKGDAFVFLSGEDLPKYLRINVLPFLDQFSQSEKLAGFS